MPVHQKRNIAAVLPVAGFCLFALLYFVAAAYYPGGSEVNRMAESFSWLHNYWCDLLEYTAENGQPNTARPIAVAAMIVLSLAIAAFWYLIPRLFVTKAWIGRTMRFSGILSMLVLAFLRNEYHDPVINTSVAFGTLAMILCLYALFISGRYGLFFMGFTCLLLCFANAYIYYTKTWINTLPVVQKLSFSIFLIWFSLLLFGLSRGKIAIIRA